MAVNMVNASTSQSPRSSDRPPSRLSRRLRPAVSRSRRTFVRQPRNSARGSAGESHNRSQISLRVATLVFNVSQPSSARALRERGNSSTPPFR